MGRRTHPSRPLTCARPGGRCAPITAVFVREASTRVLHTPCLALARCRVSVLSQPYHHSSHDHYLHCCFLNASSPHSYMPENYLIRSHVSAIPSLQCRGAGGRLRASRRLSPSRVVAVVVVAAAVVVGRRGGRRRCRHACMHRVKPSKRTNIHACKDHALCFQPLDAVASGRPTTPQCQLQHPSPASTTPCILDFARARVEGARVALVAVHASAKRALGKGPCNDGFVFATPVGSDGDAGVPNKCGSSKDSRRRFWGVLCHCAACTSFLGLESQKRVCFHLCLSV